MDYGRQSLETVCLLLAYKIKYPEKVYLLRGNHECGSISRIYGFYHECKLLGCSNYNYCFLISCFKTILLAGKRRYNLRVWKFFTDCFNCMPVAAIVDEKLFCVSGGKLCCSHDSLSHNCMELCRLNIICTLNLTFTLQVSLLI